MTPENHIRSLAHKFAEAKSEEERPGEVMN